MGTRKKFTEKSARWNLNFLLSQSEDVQDQAPPQLVDDIDAQIPENLQNLNQDVDDETHLVENYLNEAPGFRFNDINAHSDDDSETENGDVFKLPLKKFLVYWITSNNIPRSACNLLLKFINMNVDKTIPTTYMSLLNTPVTTTLISVPPGHYYHLGVKQAIKMSKFDYSQFEDGHTFHLDMNTDGVAVILFFSLFSIFLFYPFTKDC